MARKEPFTLKARPYQRWALFGLAIIWVILLAVFVPGFQNRYVYAPHGPVPLATSYPGLTTPPQAIPEGLPLEELELKQVGNDPNRMELSYKMVEMPPFWPAFAQNDDPADPWKVDLSSGVELRLVKIGIEYPIGPERARKSEFIPGQPEPVKDEEIETNEQTADDGQLVLRMEFEGSGGTIAKHNFRGAWDGTTQDKIRSSTSSQTASNKVYQSIWMRRWHDGPLHVVLDLVCGAPGELLVEPEPSGQLLELGGGRKARLLDVRAGEAKVVTSLRGSNQFLDFEYNPEPSNRTTVVVALSHPLNSLGNSIEALDANGRVLAASDRASWFQVTRITLDAPLEKIDRLRIRSYANHEQVFFVLPSVPGLPEYNRDVENFFDAKVPYFVPKEAFDMVEQISGMTQLGLNTNAEFPSGYFPKEFKDATVHELLTEYDRYVVGRSLAVNATKGVIEPKESPAWLKWLRSKIGF